MASERRRHRLKVLERGMVPDHAVLEVIRGITCLIVDPRMTDEEAEQISERWAKSLGPEGARQLCESLIWARDKINARPDWQFMGCNPHQTAEFLYGDGSLH